MAVVIFSRVIFRATDVHAAGEVYRQLLAFTGGLANVSNIVWLTLIAATALQALPHRAFELTTRAFILLPVPLRAAALVGIGLAIRQVGAAEIRPYIYFQF